MRRTGVLGLLCLLCTACEWETQRIELGFMGEAAQNDFLAVQRLLEAMDTEVVALDGWLAFEEPPSTDATFVIPISRVERFSRTRDAELGRWVEAGGHLIVVTSTAWDSPEREPDLLLDPLGVKAYRWDSEDPLYPGDPEDWSSRWTLSTAEFEDASLEVMFDGLNFVTADDPDRVQFRVGNEFGAHLLTLRSGAGRVTALTDRNFLSNSELDAHDHAELIYRLAHFEGRPGPVWILWQNEFVSWWELMLRFAWPLVLSIALGVALWLWNQGRRFGPIREVEQPERRRLMEHIVAAGHYQLENAGPRGLVEASRRQLMHAIERRYPDWSQLTPEEQAERLGTASGQAPRRIADALAEKALGDRDHFTQTITTLERLRKSL